MRNFINRILGLLGRPPLFLYRWRVPNINESYWEPKCGKLVVFSPNTPPEPRWVLDSGIYMKGKTGEYYQYTMQGTVVPHAEGDDGASKGFNAHVPPTRVFVDEQPVQLSKRLSRARRQLQQLGT